MKAIWNNTVIAESDDTIVIEGNHYFPETSINKECFQASDRQTICPWKGTAGYYHVVAGDATNNDAAWFYAEPKDAAKEIKNHFAFWKGVKVVE